MIYKNILKIIDLSKRHNFKQINEIDITNCLSGDYKKNKKGKNLKR